MASFESTLASIPGYGGYLAKRKMNEDAGMDDIRTLAALSSLSEMVQKRKDASTARDSVTGYLSSLGDSPDAQAMRAYGQINPSGLLETVVKQKMEKDLLDSENARFGLGQPAPAPAPEMLTGGEPLAAKSGDMAGLSGFQGNPQELMMQIAKSNASPQDKQMMFSQLQEQMRGAGQQSSSGLPPVPAQFAGITREMAMEMQRSPVKSLQMQGKHIADWYEKRDMLELQGQQRRDLMEFGASLRPPPPPSPEEKLAQDIEQGKRMAEIPGTAEYERVQKQKDAADAIRSRTASAIESADSTLDAIKQAREKIGFFSTGIAGQFLKNLGGTDARDLRESLEPIRASLAFDRLQQMRNESKTGGALGQVAVRELELLMATKASLDQAQTTEQLEKALNKIEGHYQQYRLAMTQAIVNGEFDGQKPAEQKSGARAEGEAAFSAARGKAGVPPPGAVRRIR